MPRLNPDHWTRVRAQYETGADVSALARAHGVSRKAIQKRAATEAWTQDVEPVIRRKVAEKVAGVVAGATPKENASALDAEAGRRAAVKRRHQDEPDQIRERLYAGLRAHKAAKDREDKALAFDDLKAAKISSECLLNIHKAERQAYGLEDGEGGDMPTPTGRMRIEIVRYDAPPPEAQDQA